MMTLWIGMNVWWMFLQYWTKWVQRSRSRPEEMWSDIHWCCLLAHWTIHGECGCQQTYSRDLRILFCSNWNSSNRLGRWNSSNQIGCWTSNRLGRWNSSNPKLDFKRKFNHRQSFLYKGRLTVRTIRKFRIGSSLRIESRIGSSIRNRIESRSFAGP